MGKKSAANYVIEKNSQGIVEDTSGELALDELFSTLSSIRLFLEKVKPIVVNDADGKEYVLKPDRRIRGTNILIHIDGPYHETPREENKDKWKDALLNEKGERNLHIRSELLTTKRYWAYLGIMIATFVYDADNNKYLFA